MNIIMTLCTRNRKLFSRVKVADNIVMCKVTWKLEETALEYTFFKVKTTKEVIVKQKLKVDVFKMSHL